MLASSLNRSEIISYFDSKAEIWDTYTKVCPQKLETILMLGDIREGIEVLDVACGTGVLFPWYLQKKVKRIVGVDVSSKMIEQARKNHQDSCIELYNQDIQQCVFSKPFDRVMVFNALPHFPCAKQLVSCLFHVTSKGGRLTIAHDMGIRHLNQVHHKRAKPVSLELISAEELSSFLSPYFTVDVCLSEDELYVVSGIRK